MTAPLSVLSDGQERRANAGPALTAEPVKEDSMAAKPLPDQSLLLKLLRYEPDTGRLLWRERDVAMFTRNQSARAWNKRCAHKQAGCPHGAGYITVRLLGCQYLAHRIIWKMVTGEEPAILDHINGIRSDNRFANLRPVNHAENARNAALQSKSKSGCHGVVWLEHRGLWLSQIRELDGSYRYLGVFEDVSEAVRVRKAAERRLGFHPNHGKPSLPFVNPIKRDKIKHLKPRIAELREAGFPYSEIGRRLDIDGSYARRILLDKTSRTDRKDNH